MQALLACVHNRSLKNSRNTHLFTLTFGAGARQEGGEGYYKRWVI